VATVDDEGLRFSNRLSCTLKIELSEPSSQLAPNLHNRVAAPSAGITGISLSAKVMGDNYKGVGRDLTPSVSCFGCLS
jgi:hypothetical protein